MSYFGKYYLVGQDAARAVDRLFTADLRRPAGVCVFILFTRSCLCDCGYMYCRVCVVRAGRTVYTCLLNARGGTETDMTVSVVENPAHGRVPAAGRTFEERLMELDRTPYAPNLSGVLSVLCFMNSLVSFYYCTTDEGFTALII